MARGGDSPDGGSASFPGELQTGFFLTLLKPSAVSNLLLQQSGLIPPVLTQEGGGGDGAIAPGHHHTDSSLHEGHGEVHNLGALLVDSEGPDGHVCALVVDLGRASGLRTGRGRGGEPKTVLLVSPSEQRPGLNQNHGVVGLGGISQPQPCPGLPS